MGFEKDTNQLRNGYLDLFLLLNFLSNQLLLVLINLLVIHVNILLLLITVFQQIHHLFRKCTNLFLI